MAARRGRRTSAVRLLRRPRRERTYVGDIRAASFRVMVDDRVVTPYVGLWADLENGTVVSSVVVLERPDEALADGLINPSPLSDSLAPLSDPAAGAMALVESYQPPERAVVFDGALAATLRRRIGSRGIAVEVRERIEAFDALLDALLERMRMVADAQAPTLDLSDEVLRRLCAAAERLWEEKPWRYCEDDPPIAVESLDSSSGPVYAAVLGGGGEIFGLALYTSLEDYAALFQLDDPPDEDAPAAVRQAYSAAIQAAHRHPTYLISFEQKSDVIPADLDRLVAAGWSRRRRVVPSFLAQGGPNPIGRFGDAEGRRFAPVLDALTAFCHQARGRIADIYSQPIQLVAEVTVEDLDGPRRFRVATPPDAPTSQPDASDRSEPPRRSALPTSPNPAAAAASSGLPIASAAAGPPGSPDRPTFTIDDPDEVASLMAAMGEHLPIPATATPELVRSLGPRGSTLGKGRSLSIASLVYLGDEGGIGCNVTRPGAKEVWIVSLTHLRIAPGHPLYQRIRAYQRARTRRLSSPGQ